MYDVVVVGGGPAGSMAAAALSEDHDVLVIEEHETSGSPVQCAGIVTKHVLDMSGVRPTILNRLFGAEVIFPNEESVCVRSDDVKAYLIDRGDLDRKLAEKAMDAGAEYKYSTKYLSHKVSDGTVTIQTDSGPIESKLIIGADGHTSAVSGSIPDNQPLEYVRGVEYDIRNRMDCQELVRIRIGNDVAPGMFSWEAPFGDFTRVGLCTSWSAGPPFEYLKKLLSAAGLSDKEVIAKYSGKIPVGGRRVTYADNLLLIGDAAGQVKPVSAGGLYPLMSCIPYLREAAECSFTSGDFSAAALSSYEKAWKKDIGKELSRAYKLRKCYVKFDDNDMNKMCQYLSKDKANKILNGVDIDRPSGFAMKAFSHLPTMMKLLSVTIKHM